MKRSPPPPGAGFTATPVGLPSSQPMPGTSTQVQPPGVPGNGPASTMPALASGLPFPGAVSPAQPAAATPAMQTKHETATLAAAACLDGNRIARLYAQMACGRMDWGVRRCGCGAVPLTRPPDGRPAP